MFFLSLFNKHKSKIASSIMGVFLVMFSSNSFALNIIIDYAENGDYVTESTPLGVIIGTYGGPDGFYYSIDETSDFQNGAKNAIEQAAQMLEEYIVDDVTIHVRIGWQIFSPQNRTYVPNISAPYNGYSFSSPIFNVGLLGLPLPPASPEVVTELSQGVASALKQKEASETEKLSVVANLPDSATNLNPNQPPFFITHANAPWTNPLVDGFFLRADDTSISNTETISLTPPQLMALASPQAVEYLKSIFVLPDANNTYDNLFQLILLSNGFPVNETFMRQFDVDCMITLQHPELFPEALDGVQVINDYDYDRTDGIDLGKTDFVGLVAHELLHCIAAANSGATIFSLNRGFVTPTVLDLFRFASDKAHNMNMRDFASSTYGRIVKPSGFEDSHFLFIDSGTFKNNLVVMDSGNLFVGSFPGHFFPVTLKYPGYGLNSTVELLNQQDVGTEDEIKTALTNNLHQSDLVLIDLVGWELIEGWRENLAPLSDNCIYRRFMIYFKRTSDDSVDFDDLGCPLNEGLESEGAVGSSGKVPPPFLP